MAMETASTSRSCTPYSDPRMIHIDMTKVQEYQGNIVE